MTKDRQIKKTKTAIYSAFIAL
ncbi:TPA: TetR/AcrR family transcriptional regulator, partial [Streptococcus pyogenes]|nr:TetR/AcrR family transcriptional regulator [Streptococcus pyogenes]